MNAINVRTHVCHTDALVMHKVHQKYQGTLSQILI